jgi:hypothetical protein
MYKWGQLLVGLEKKGCRLWVPSLFIAAGTAARAIYVGDSYQSIVPYRKRINPDSKRPKIRE